MKFKLVSLVAATLLAAPAFAQTATDAVTVTGDAAKGEKVFNQCQACHMVVAPDGTVLAGRNGKIGPNLYGLPGRKAAAVEDFKYSKGLHEAEEKGLVWDEANFTQYVQDPTKFLQEFTGDKKARAAMMFKIRKEEDAQNVYAYLASLVK